MAYHATLGGARASATATLTAPSAAWACCSRPRAGSTRRWCYWQNRVGRPDRRLPVGRLRFAQCCSVCGVRVALLSRTRRICAQSPGRLDGCAQSPGRPDGRLRIDVGAGRSRLELAARGGGAVQCTDCAARTCVGALSSLCLAVLLYMDHHQISFPYMRHDSIVWAGVRLGPAPLGLALHERDNVAWPTL